MDSVSCPLVLITHNSKIPPSTFDIINTASSLVPPKLFTTKVRGAVPKVTPLLLLPEPREERKDIKGTSLPVPKIARRK